VTSAAHRNDDYKGGQLFNRVDRNKLTQDFAAAAQWLKAHPLSSGKVCVTGFCFGGGVSDTLATLPGADLAAAAPFYGGAPALTEVPKIKAAILVHHGALDPHEGHLRPNSVHGFFNDATPERYNKNTAPQAWSRTIEWFNQDARS